MQNGKICFSEISEHRLLTALYLESGLEISDDWVETSGVFLSEVAFCDEDFCKATLCRGEFSKPPFFEQKNTVAIAAYSLSERFGVTVLDYIAVKKDGRERGIGSAVLQRVKERCRTLGVKKIYFTARARAFFLKNGAKELSQRQPLFFELLGECAKCEQRDKECFPVVMMMDV